MRLLLWTENLMIGRGLRRKMNRTLHRLELLEKHRKRSLHSLNKRKKEIELAHNDLSLLAQRLSDSLEEAVKVQKEYQEQLEGAQSQLRIMEDVTVPALLQQNQTLLEMWKAETAIQIRRQVNNQQPPLSVD